ncbi:MAG: PKD domain-containing protein [Candidatus Limnocylindrales bacterium]
MAARIRRCLGGDERGQSLVEFALTLPVILLLTLIALDFGRVYLGYINLQNMSRIASNFAANHPEAWGTHPDTRDQTRYRNQILADAAATNCQLPQSGGTAVVPTPVFVDRNADGSTSGLGDTVNVTLTCTFQVITPGIANILGGSIAVSADADFPVKAGMSAVAAGGGGPVIGSAPVAAFSGNGTVTPAPITVIGPTVDVEFRDTSGGSPTAWSWNFADGTTSTAQDPLQHTFSCAFSSCSFIVTMTATNIVGSSSAQMTVIVIGTSNVNFTASTQSGTAPLAVSFTDASSPGGTAWAWTFGDGVTGTGATTSHTYTVTGTYSVKLTVTYPSPTGNVSTTKTGFISVAVNNCTVPKLVGLKYNNAQAAWNAAGFSGTVTRGPGAPVGNFTITAQSLVYTSSAPCTSGVSVAAP